jgi:hypothetical protein
MSHWMWAVSIIWHPQYSSGVWHEHILPDRFRKADEGCLRDMRRIMVRPRI